MSGTVGLVQDNALRVDGASLAAFVESCLLATGADRPSATAATRAMMHGSRLGVDSHGVRLLEHYVRAYDGGRLNRTPALRFVRSLGAVANLDADHAHGALGAYRAMEKAVELAGTHGMGAVSVGNTSHFGPAGAYAIEAAERGLIGLAFCNSDAFMRLHDGAARFHGTNPIACAVPIAGDRPWLLDMATSAIPYNRVLLFGSLGRRLPDGVVSDSSGIDTDDPGRADMLAPLGGPFGFKGAGLAGMVEIFCSVLAAMPPSHELLPMSGPDMSTPRGLSAFVMAIRPDAFLPREEFEAGMRRYVDGLRGSPARQGMRVMAPGDREWDEEARRRRTGIPIDPATAAAFEAMAERFSLPMPRRADETDKT